MRGYGEFFSTVSVWWSADGFTDKGGGVVFNIVSFQCIEKVDEALVACFWIYVGENVRFCGASAGGCGIAFESVVEAG